MKQNKRLGDFLGIGYLVMYFYLAARLIKEYGGLGKSLGWDYIYRGKKGYGPPPAVVATTIVIIANSTGILAGATVIVKSIINIIYPAILFIQYLPSIDLKISLSKPKYNHLIQFHIR